MRLFIALLLALGVCAHPAWGAEDSPRVTASFDGPWRFSLGDPKEAQTPAFNDSAWRQVSAPHDWSIETTGKNAASQLTFTAGIGWYRKSFFFPAEYSQQCVFLEFDGVMANCEVWANGVSVGKRPNGYVGFRCDLTGRLNCGPGKTNVIAVRVDNSRQPASRWHTGAGIERHVRLVVTSPVHIAPSGIYVTTPSIASGHATVRVQTTVTNQSKTQREISVRADIFGPEGQIVQSGQTRPQLLGPGQTADLTQEITLLHPQLWDTDHPHVYHACATVRSGSASLDSDITEFGFREIRFEPLTGFFLNDRALKIKGVCLRPDGGAFGGAVPMRIWERRLDQLKLIGCNALRTSSPPAPEFLDLCDRMGFLVMDDFFDAWTDGKTAYDYHRFFKDWAKADLRDAVQRDRNHPSVILYNIGNEIRDTRNSAQAKRSLVTLRDICHQLDPTRPVTMALYRPDLSKDYKNGLADLLDVIGQNYRESDLMAAYAAKPDRKMIQTESGPELSAWIAIRDNPACAGQFLWIGVDSLGQSPGAGISAGLLDRTGAFRPQAYERRALWSDTPMVRVTRRIGGAAPQSKGTNAPKLIDSTMSDPMGQRQLLYSDWTPRGSRSGKETVEVYGNCQEIELFLNGKSLGSKTRTTEELPSVWMVSYEPGVLRAVGKNNGLPVAMHELRTAGAPAALALSASEETLGNDWNDVCQVRVTVVDSSGTIVPDATPLIAFKVTGPGVLAATDSANNAARESFSASERRAFNGQTSAFIKASASGSGKITVTATSAGLPPAAISIDTVK